MTKKVVLKSLCFLIALTVVSNVFLLLPSSAETVNAASYSYNANAALAYAEANWDSGVGDCADYVKKCLQAGGLNVSATGTNSLAKSITSVTGGEVVARRLNLDSSGYATQTLNQGMLQAGDVVEQYCESCGIYSHALLCGGFKNGRASFYAHNNAQHNAAFPLNNKHSSKLDNSYCGHTLCAFVFHFGPAPEIKGGTQVVPNGDYLICSANQSNGVYFLDVEGASTSPADGTNVGIWGPLSTQPAAHDVWTLNYSNGFYSIKQKGTNMALDIHGADAYATANAWLYSSNGGSAQQWKITQNGVGYRLQARCSGLSLDIDGAKMAAGTNVQQYYDNDSDAQRWILIPYKQGQKVSVKDLNCKDIIKNVSISDVSTSGYTVTCEVADYSIQKIVFPTWTIQNGQDDLFKDWGNTAVGTRSGNKVTYRVNTSQHGNQKGCEYVTHIYVVDYFGNTTGVSQDQYKCLLVNVPATNAAPPTATPKPTSTPVPTATATPTVTTVPAATSEPTAAPTDIPSVEPTAVPTENPSAEPTSTPTSVPASEPTSPTGVPTEIPAPTDKNDNSDITLAFDKTTETTMVCGKKMTLKVDADEDEIEWESSDAKIATVSSSGKVTAKMAGSVTITATVGDKTAQCVIQVLYKDVKDTSKFWFEPTNYLTNLGVVKGYDNQTKFKPANECTRAQMITFIWRLEGCPTPTTQKCKFSDVKKSDYFYEACLWGNENHIVEGYKNGTFGPRVVCARRHAVTFLWRLAGEPDPTSSENKFKDVKKSDYFYTATQWASEKGILAGYSDNTFRPNGNCLRRQMVTFLYKYDKYVKENN